MNVKLKLMVWYEMKRKRVIDYFCRILGITELYRSLGQKEHLIRQLEREVNRLNDLTKDLFQIGVDVSMAEKDQTLIAIVSKVAGGQVRIMSTHIQDLKDLQELTRSLEYRYNVSRKEVRFDMPPYMRPMFNDFDRQRHF